ncbi:MAG: NUDIX hydrolase [Phycisphaerales bacterium]|nr:NUDIX hydrolase [Phycisphaerae bacterium]NNF43341.1 NUDIX hydrolase [Phycisphaerales bacterium]NNM27033.1 NUDIX hydrolase [Phycisphaerales bacterium]
MTARAIRLRRPPQVSGVGTPFVPDGDRALFDEIACRWEQRCRDNPALFDGRVCHVIGVHRNGCGGAVLHVAECAYRFFAVQDERFDLGVRPLGVKGIVERDGRLLMGRRAEFVGGYPGQWELAPAGVVEPGTDPAAVLARELREETGLEAAGEPIPVAILFDDVLRCWEIVARLDARPGGAPVTNEYTELRWCERDRPPAPLTPIATRILTLDGGGGTGGAGGVIR